MADPDPANPSQQPPGVDRQALAAAHERRVANPEFVDILTSPPARTARRCKCAGSTT
jgi:hypothetical protein